MGGTESSARPAAAKVHVTETPAPLKRMSIDRVTVSLPNLTTSWGHFNTDHLLEQPFSAVWSNLVLDAPMPSQRVGHFSVFNDEKAFIGYGLSLSGEILSDVWELDLATRVWRKIEVTGDTISGRSGAAATIDGDFIYVFGGVREKEYCGDLHSINWKTGAVRMLPASGCVPAARSTAILQYYEGELVLWGGFNGEWPTTLSVYDIASGEWSESDPKITGRAGASWALVGEKVLSYGGSRSGELLEIDIPKRAVSVIPCKGCVPPSDTVEGQMLLVERFLLYFGGKSASDWTFVYACDLDRMSWFVFCVKPDEVTVHLSDGKVSDLGMFMIPRIHGFGACYYRKLKQIIGYLGAPQADQNKLYVLDVSDALASIHLYEDMLKAMEETSETVQGTRPVPAILRTTRSCGLLRK